MNNTTKSPMSLDDAKHLEGLYSLFRNYIERENTLINNRMTWLMTVQSFVIATFGFSYQKAFEVLSKIYMQPNASDLLKTGGDIALMIHDYKYFLAILAVIGIFTSLVALMSIGAAFTAIDNIIKKWQEFFLQEKWGLVFKTTLQFNYLPGIAGGGSDNAVRFGKWFALALPAFFFLFWSLVLLLVIIKKVNIEM